LPGVFAVGDVLGSSIKRVASAVGEGSIAFSFVHHVLQEQEGGRLTGEIIRWSSGVGAATLQPR
jgi:hypothetical protein